MNKNQIAFALFIGLLAFLIHQTLFLVLPFFRPIFWAFIAAFAFGPAHKRIKSTLKDRDGLAALLTTVLIVLIIVPVAALLVMRLVDESSRFFEWFKTAVDNGSLERLMRQWKTWPPMRFADRYMDLDRVSASLAAQMSSGVSSAGKIAGVQALKFFAGTMSMLLGLLFFVLFLYFFLKEGERGLKKIHDAIPLKEANKLKIFNRAKEVFEAVIKGQLLSAFIQAVLLAVIFAVMGLPIPVFFGFLTFFCALVPMMGAPLIWFPFVIFLATQGAYLKAGILAGLGLGVIGMVDNVIHPLLIGNKTKLPYPLLLVSIVGGLQMYGIIGIFLGPVVMTLLFVCVEILTGLLDSQPTDKTIKV